ncbi:MAG: ATP-binding protein [Pseudomonadota bacterium]
MAASNKIFPTLFYLLVLLLAAVGLTGYFAAAIGENHFFFYGLAMVLPLATWVVLGIRRLARDEQETVDLRRLASIPEENPNMILEVNNRGEITFVNRSCRQRFKPGENDKFHPLFQGVQAMLDDREEAIRTEYQDELEVDGAIFERRIRIVPAAGLARVYAFDITKLKKVERDLLEATKQVEGVARLKSVFLSNIGHEIRTPLNAVIGYTELLLLDDPGDKERKRLAIIKQAGKNLLQLINDILDFAKIESGRLVIVNEEFDPHQLIAAVQQDFSHHACSKNLDFRVIVGDNMPARMIGDAKRIKQVLASLLSNAFKFTEKGAVTLSCGYDEGVFISRISDTGIGIPAEQQWVIFAEFQQGDVADSRKYGGAGLGLSISKRLVSLMEGELALESEPGSGSSFTIRLPIPVVGRQSALTKTESNERAGVEKVTGALAFAGVDLQVLIAEDDEVNQGLLKALLHQVGIEAEVAANGRVALDRLAEKDFDLLFLDMQMPVLDGMATIAEIRNSSQWRNLHVIALTGEALPHDAEKFIAAGCDSYLAKPVELEFFYGKIYALLAERFSFNVEDQEESPAMEERSAMKGESLQMSRELRFHLLQALDVLKNNLKIFNPDQLRMLSALFADFDDQGEIRLLQQELQRIAATFDDEALPQLIGKIEEWETL